MAMTLETHNGLQHKLDVNNIASPPRVSPNTRVAAITPAASPPPAPAGAAFSPAAAPKTLSLPMNVAMSGCAGCTAWLFTHPFELMKNKVILNPELSMAEVFKSTIKDGGVAGLWKGLSGGVSRQIVYTSCRLGFYEPIKHIVAGKDTPASEVTVFQRASAGAIAGMSASLLSSPVEVCLVLQSGTKEKIGLPQAFKRVANEHGVKGFWRGAVPLTSRAALVGISQVAMFDQVKTTLNHKNTEHKWSLTPMQIFIASSSFTALFYAFITMPIELSRVKLSNQPKPKQGEKPKFTGMVQAIGVLAKEDGVMNLYKSFAPYVLRCAVHTIMSFIIIDTVKPMLL